MTQRFVTDGLARELEVIAKSSTSLRATTAFWTLEYGNYICSPLQSLLENKESFFVTDVSPPTNIDYLIQFAEQGCNMYLYLKRLMNDALYKYHHLLHSKIMLFESTIPNQAVLVLGSHNMTFRAMSGIGNREASLIIYLEKNEPLYSEVSDYLNLIRKQSHKVDPKLIDLYKLLQGEDTDEFVFSVPLIHIITHDANYLNLLSKDASILLLGVNDSEYAYSEHIKDQRRKIALYIQNWETKESKVVLCNIKSSGAININQPDTYSKEYEPRMFFFIGLTKNSGASSPAYLYEKREITKELFYLSEFHAELYVESIYSDVFLPPKKSLKSEFNPWKDDPVSFETSLTEMDVEFSGDRKVSLPDWKLQTVDPRFLSENHLDEIKAMVLKMKRKSKKTSSLEVSTLYIETQKKILGLLNESTLNEESKLRMLKKIESLLNDIFEQSNMRLVRRNHKVIKRHMLFSADKEGF